MSSISSLPRTPAPRLTGYGSTITDLMRDYDDEAEIKLPFFAGNKEARDLFEKRFPGDMAATRDRLAQMMDAKTPPFLVDFKMSLLYAFAIGMHNGGGIALHTLPAQAVAAPTATPARLPQSELAKQIDACNDEIQEACAGLHERAADPAQRGDLQQTADDMRMRLPVLFMGALGDLPASVDDFQGSVVAAYLVGLSTGALHAALILHPEAAPSPAPAPPPPPPSEPTWEMPVAGPAAPRP
jgi:hypothetical protein